MGYKIKHYAQPVSTNTGPLWESALIELSVGLICAGMAFWARDIVIQLFFGCLVIAGICFFLTLQNIIEIFRIRAKNKKLFQNQSEDYK